ncbi:sensor histidine kinase [Deinococcus kurensis]|uniref:sensor histidine kinase n=1 Tax=Deinococcus kurensis TaxID=2662757 RepID=UPI0012D2C19E|nr:HAMP domain-containing sensor histidine kinase [Deinococcus kurensis]
MKLRLRLTVAYGLLFAAVLTALSVAGYAALIREQFVTLDRVLVTTARLVESGILRSGRSYALDAETARPSRDGIVIVLRSYAPDGTLAQRSPNDPGLPVTAPWAPLRTPAPPAFWDAVPLPDWIVRREVVGDGQAFGTLGAGGQRWRRYVVQIRQATRTVGYVEALTPLARADDTAQAATRLFLTVLAGTVLGVLGISWVVAGAVLRPVTALTRAARTVAGSRDLTRRVRPGPPDELGQLTVTFNEMLGRLQRAWASQQRFVEDASHELRAPMTVLRGNLDLLRQYPRMDAAERAEVVADMDRETWRLSRLIEDLLLLAQREQDAPPPREGVSLREVAQAAAQDAQKLSPAHNVTLHLQPAGDPLTVPGHRDEVQQLLLILLDNAVKYSPGGTRVGVRVQGQPGSVQVDVEDQGVGIDAEDLPHIFHRFYRADPARQRQGGTGLGLAIAQLIASRHGAALFVARTGPGGTVFRVTFPLSGGTPLEPRPEGHAWA